MRFLGTLVLIIFFVAIFGVGQALYEADVEDNTTRNIQNLTENTFVWNSSNFNTSKMKMEDKLNESNLDMILLSHRLSNIIYKGIDFVGFAAFEISKWGVEFGYNHPEYNFLEATKAMPKIIKTIMILLVCFLLIKAALPLFAIFYITGVGIKKLIGIIKKKRRKPNKIRQNDKS